MEMTQTKWHVKDAKDGFPRTAAVVLSNEEYRSQSTKLHLVDFFLESPLRGLNIDLSRGQEP
ncbi:MAG: hypothetical protein QNK37_15185 [Acidobacteriota bacterium]|nr:hypothetical protein [Acidobacteriota bacterium]